MHPLILPPRCLAALLFLGALPSSAAPLITEFLTNNNTGILDEDLTRQDWIEIHNPDPSTLDFSGYHLTDDSGLPARWTVPSGVTIPAGGYLVIFASGKDRAVAGSPLHTNFSLASGGEYLGMYAPGGMGAAVSEYAPTYPAQSGDISYGLLNPVAGSPVSFFTVPTPGAANNSANAPAETVTFTVASKTFNQGTTFPVSLSTPSGTATIRYTLNRAMPINEDGVAPTVTVDPATDIWTSTAHGLKNLDPVQIHSSTGTYPTLSGSGITYFVTVLSANTFKLSDDPGGVTLNVTTAGGGIIHVRRHAAQWTIAGATTSITVTEHRFYDRDPVQVTTTGTLPTGLAAGTTYYILLTDRNTVQLSATPGGGAITMTTAGSGTHTLKRVPSTLYTAPITVNHSLRLRAGSFQTGRANGALVSQSYLMLDAAAQAFTSNIPVMILHSFGSGHPNGTAQTPEDTKEDVWFTFEPKPEGTPPATTLVTRLTNPPDLVAPGYFERRGSSTFGAAKYSMTMGAFNEFGEGGNVSPLGFASNDDFVLNAHFEFDRSLMHNDLIYRLSNEAGRYAPNTRHVEVIMSVGNDVGAAGALPAYGVVNGATTGADYYGVFSFQDKISKGNNRLDIEKLELTDNTAPNVQGGYIFKIDRLDAGDAGVAAAGRSFALVQPKEWSAYPGRVQVATDPQKAYLQTTLNNMNAALNSPNFMNPTTGYAAHLDVPACIDHWWLSVLPKSADAFRLSGYWHKSRYGKLAMGPVFDFDRAMGSTDGRDRNPLTWRGDVPDYGTDYFHNAGIFTPNYFQPMFQDPNFWQAIIDRYEDLRKGVLSTAHVHAIISEWTELLDPGDGANTPAKRNGTKWLSSYNPYYRNAAGNTPGTNGTFRGETQWLKNWWGKAGAVTANGRFDFVDGQFMRPPVGSQASGPVAPGSPVTLSSPSQSTSGVKIYYTTNGTDPRAPGTTAQPLYQPGALTTLATILPEIGPVRAIVPDAAFNTSFGNNWRNEVFDDSTWFTNGAGTVNGVGYDNNFAAGAPDYQPLLSVRWNTTTYYGTAPAGITPPGVLPVGTNNVMFTSTISAVSYPGNQTCYVRIPFTLSAAQLALAVFPNKLTLQMHCDDGFAAWLNGTELTSARLNAPATAALTYNSAATTGNPDGNAIVYADFDITAFMGSLHTGANVLAIHGLNAGLTSSDFLIGAKIAIQGNSAPQPAYTPSLTAGATEYTGALTVNAPMQIVARTLFPLLASDPPTATTVPAPTNGGVVPNGSSWSAPTRLYYFPGAVSASQASIKITEVHYHPAPPAADEIALGYLNSNDFEFIRLTNTGAVPVDLTGIYFSNGLEFTAVPGLQNWLPAGASVVVVENTAAFTYRYGSTFTILGEFNGELDDGGEHIVLNDKTGAIISDFIYGDDAPWPESADDGYSLVYVSGDQNLPASWRASLDPGGSAANTYANWLRRYYLTSELAGQPMAQNDDGDELNNLGEYGFATDPHSAGSGEYARGVAVPGVPPGLAIRRRSGTTDLTWILETSTDLAPGVWTPSGAAPASVVSNGDGTETATWAAPPMPPGTRLYLRVRVTSP